MQWNAQSLKMKVGDLTDNLLRKDVDVVSICETRITQEYRLPRRLHRQYDLILTQRIGREGWGKAILVNKQSAVMEEVKKEQLDTVEYVMVKCFMLQRLGTNNCSKFVYPLKKRHSAAPP